MHLHLHARYNNAPHPPAAQYKLQPRHASGATISRSQPHHAHILTRTQLCDQAPPYTHIRIYTSRNRRETYMATELVAEIPKQPE